MLCNVCGKSEASIHLTEIVNGQMLELHLCEICSNEKETESKAQFSVNDLLSGLTDLTNQPSAKKSGEDCCPKCSMAYESFSKSGRLGCPYCYEHFFSVLISLLDRIQRGTRHTGKTPEVGGNPEAVKRKSLELLQERLSKSVLKEDFEEAARIRDEIKALEAKPKKTVKSRKKKEA